MTTSSISSEYRGEFRARPLGRGHYSPFKIKDSKSEPTRSFSPETLRRSKATKKVVAEEPVPEFKAKPLPRFVKRRVSTSEIQNNDYNSGVFAGSALRRKSANVSLKPPGSPANVTKLAPFSMQCDKLMSSRKQAEAERAERLRLAEEERIRKQNELQRIKDREIEEELNKHMFKARPVPKFLSRTLPSQ